MIQQHVVDEYQLELERAKVPGYVSRYDDAYESSDADAGTPGAKRADGPDIPPPHLTPERPRADASKDADSNAGQERPPRANP